VRFQKDESARSEDYTDVWYGVPCRVRGCSMMRSACVLVVAICGVALAQQKPPAPAAPPAAVKEAPPGPAVLRARIGVFDFKQTTLEKSLDEIGRRVKLSVTIDWAALREAKIGGDTGLSLHLTNATLADGLRAILDGASRPGAALEYDIRDDIYISTRAAFARRLFVRVYPCGELLKGQLSAEEQLNLDNSVARLWKQHYAVFGPPWRPLSERAGVPRVGQRQETSALVDELQASLRARRIGQIIDVLYSTIDPESWADERATIRVVGDSLVVSQSAPNHRAIAALLAELRNAEK